MAEKITFNGKPAKRGERVSTAAGWRLLHTTGVLRYWVATMVQNIEVGDEQIVIFRVRKS